MEIFRNLPLLSAACIAIAAVSEGDRLADLGGRKIAFDVASVKAGQRDPEANILGKVS